MRSLEADVASDEEKIRAYEAELAVLVDGLKRKHGYDAVSESLGKNRAELAALRDLQTRDAAFLAVNAIYGLLDAGPGRLGEFLDWLEERWHVVEQHNDYADGRDYVSHFGEFVDNVCRDEWWSEGKYEALDGGDIRIEQDQRHGKDPCIALVLPAGVLSDPMPFVDDCGRFMRAAAEEWATGYVKANAGRTAKLDALRKALAEA